MIQDFRTSLNDNLAVALRVHEKWDFRKRA
jgi:hypothetical protein